MSDDEIARLRKLAEREARDRHDAAQWCASHSERDDRDEWAYVSLMDLRNAVDGATILALLDERDAAMALLRVAKVELENAWRREEWAPDSTADALNRIDALLGGGEGA